MKTFPLSVTFTRSLADTLTPVSAYLRLRQRFPGTLLLESADYRGRDNSFSYLCFAPLATLSVERDKATTLLPDGTTEITTTLEPRCASRLLSQFVDRFQNPSTSLPAGAINGVFGYTSYDAIELIEDIALKNPVDPCEDIPLIHYSLFAYVLAFNHFRNEIYLIENRIEGAPHLDRSEILKLLFHGAYPTTNFTLVGEELSPLTDEQHYTLIAKTKEHIARGDIFQIVPSRKFRRCFSGDDFNVYRALRSLNPSPYLFFFDCGSFHLSGSSPEAQLIIKDGRASIFPIAGTYRRSGDDTADRARAEALLHDPKENSEHVMLVDLARNDLSIHCHPVTVEQFKEIQVYSHVIHLVSKVTGTLTQPYSAAEILYSSFPAGTLSGAPKYRAMELIDKYEGSRRHFYGGCVGYLGFNGECTHAIMIRSFMSRGDTIYLQAGGGVVANSDPASEIEETRGKLGALRAALALAMEVSL